MGTIDEVSKKLGGKPPPEKVSPFSGKSAAGPMSDLEFVVGLRKRKPVSLLLALALVGAGALVYLLLPKEIPKPPTPAIVAITKLPLPAPVAMPASAVEPVSSVGPIKQDAPETPPASTVADAEQAVSPPGWYEAGWRAVKEGRRTDALTLWEDGMRGLPKDRMVIVSNSYATPEQFLSALNQHGSMFPAIGIRQRLGGRMLYRVIVFPYGGGTREILPKVQKLFSYAWLANASRVWGSLAENSMPVAARHGKETIREEMPGAGQKPHAEQMPPVEQKPSAEQKLVAEQKPVAEQKLVAEQKPHEEKLEAANRIATEIVAAPSVGDWEARSAVVREQLKAEDYAGVSKNAQMLVQDFQERWESWFWLGTAQLAQGQLGVAEAALERASKLNPKVAQIWVQRAIVAQERGDHTTAVKLLNEARELAPKSPKIFLNLGFSNDALGLIAEADKNYLRFLSLTEGDGSYAMQRKPIIDRMESRH